jgi:hypothetical protein
MLSVPAIFGKLVVEVMGTFSMWERELEVYTPVRRIHLAHFLSSVLYIKMAVIIQEMYIANQIWFPRCCDKSLYESK